jgi:hypothetical protein
MTRPTEGWTRRLAALGRGVATALAVGFVWTVVAVALGRFDPVTALAASLAVGVVATLLALR